MNIPHRHRIGKRLPFLMTAGLGVLAVLAAITSPAGIQGSGFRKLLVVGTVTEPAGGKGDTIVVSGTPYSTDGAVFQVDGQGASQAQIHAGDVVSMTANAPVDGGTPSVTQVTFSGSVQGAVSGIDSASSTLFVLGQTIHVNSSTSFGSNLRKSGLSGLQIGDVVEVSGFGDSTGAWIATSIDSKGHSSVARVVGSVKSLDPTQRTFYLNSLKIDYDSAAMDTGLTEGVAVSVQGLKFAADGSLVAKRVQSAAAVPAQADALGRIQGLITRYPSSAYFEVNGQPVSVNAQTRLTLPVPTGLDVEVQVTGTFDSNGVLVADSVQTGKNYSSL